MSYYSTNSLRWDDNNLTQDALAHRLAELGEEDFHHVTERTFNGESAKWYDADEELTVLSTEHPGVLFTLESKGEDGEHTISWFRDGRMLSLVVEPPPFDSGRFEAESRPGPVKKAQITTQGQTA